MILFTWNNIKKGLLELIKTLSAKQSFFSSKRLERFFFTGTSLGLVIGAFIYLWINKQLTAADTVILISPLLLAAGYNLNKTEQAKKENNEG